MRAKRLVVGALAGVVALTVIGGCAAQEVKALEPKLELRNAAQQLAAAQQGGFTLKLNGTAEDVVAAMKLAAKTDTSVDVPTGEEVTMLKKVFASSLTLAFDKAGAGDADDRSMVSADVDGVTGTEIRYVDGILYAKAPVADLATKFGAKPADVKALSEQAAGGLPGMDDLLAGKWVSVDGKKLTDLAGSSAGMPTPSVDPQTVAKQLTTSATTLLDGATVVRDTADSKHLIVTTSTAKGFAEVKRIAAAVNEQSAAMLKDEPKDRPIVLDLWIDGGKLTAAEINLLQFVDGSTGRVAVRMEMTAGAAITAPTGATEIDLDALAGAATA